MQFLVDNPLLTLAIIAALGAMLGQIKLAGSSLGPVAVLFVGLAFGAIEPRLRLPDLVYLMGLVIFVYTIGLSSGPSFFASLRHQGIRDATLCGGLLLAGALLLLILQQWLGLAPLLVAGIFAGSFTNTPALAVVLDVIRGSAPPDVRDALLAAPVVGYSATYIVGVLSPLLAMLLLPRLLKVNYAEEAEQLRAQGLVDEPLTQRTICITRTDLRQQPLVGLARAQGWDVVFGRLRHNQELALVGSATCAAPGDLIAAIGTTPQLDRVTAALGTPSDERLDADRRTLDYRRVFVSNPAVVGRPLADLQLPERCNALITRVRRGDQDLLPHGDTVLELGDRVRVVTNPSNMSALSSFFGDSYRALSEVNIVTLCLGLAGGLLLGLIPIPLPGGLQLSLGYAGGPLLMALFLGARERTGPLVWSLPYSANLTLRQIGLVLFLAGVGTRAGAALLDTFASGDGLTLVLVGATATTSVVLLAFWVGYRLLHIPMSLLLGSVAGIHTHPALLSVACEQTGNDAPLLAYTAIYPVAMITKIVLVQLLLLWMG